MLKIPCLCIFNCCCNNILGGALYKILKIHDNCVDIYRIKNKKKIENENVLKQLTLS